MDQVLAFNPISPPASFADLNQFIVPALIVFIALIPLVQLMVLARRYQKVGPDELLVISGRRYPFRDPSGNLHFRGFRIVRGGGTVVWPIIEKAEHLSLKPVSVDLRLDHVAAGRGGNLELAAQAVVRIKPEPEPIHKAAEALLGQTPTQVQEVATRIIEGSVRSHIGGRAAGQLADAEAKLATDLQEAAKPALANLGLELLSFSLRELRMEPPRAVA